MTASSPQPPLLEVRDLTKSYAGGGLFSRRRTQVLREVAFTVDRGEAVALVGESGSGKSTIARQVIRLESPDSGQILLDGVDLLRAERRPTLAFRRRVQMIFQDPFGSLNPQHTVARHLERPLLIHGRATRSGVRDHTLRLLEEVGLSPAADFAEKHPHALSGGQRQRVAIARALAPGPELIVADEPTSMLDVSLRIEILNLLARKKRDSRLGLVLITHDLASARYLADRVLVLYGGQLMESAPSEALLQRPAHPYTQLLLAAADRSGHRQGPAADPTPPSPLRAQTRSQAGPTGGCPFSARCPHVLARCHDTRAPWLEVGPAHHVRCHLPSLAPLPAAPYRPRGGAPT